MNASDLKHVQNLIREKLQRGTELMVLESGEESSGVEGTIPQQYFVTTEISGVNRYHEWESKDSEYHYLPSFGFHVIIGRAITSPFSSFEEDRMVAYKNEGITSGGRSWSIGTWPTDKSEVEKIKLWITPRKNVDFFDLLNAIREGDRFAPFEVTGDKTVIDNTETRYWINIDAYVEEDKVSACITDLKKIELENIISNLIDIFVEESAHFKKLKPLFQATDEDGTRLWTDQGLQFPAYYALRKKLGRRLLKKVMKVLRRHKIGYMKSWSLGYNLALIRYSFSEYGLMTVPLVLRCVKEWFKNLFKNRKAQRMEQLKNYKEGNRGH